MFRTVFRLGRHGSWGGQSRVAALAAVAAVLLLALSGLFGTIQVQAKGPAASQTATITVSQLPAQGQAMMTLIYQGGPFKYDKDGTVFGNRERLLPAQQRGYYREYTVQTPGERSRGARRLVCGGQRPAAPDACFYTDDHYASFRQVVR
jgi:ribonuclease T1